jgi:thiol-disulfide isomerase/thioredoxin
MKNLITFIFLIFWALGNAQSIYYSTDGKDRYAEEGLRSLVKLMDVEINKTLGKNLKKNLYTHVNVERMEIRKDSLIYFLAFEFTKEKPKSFINYSSSPVYKFYNKELPEFSLKTIEGKTFTNKSLKGKPTLINFWFTSCLPCIQEMPILNQLKEKYKDDFNFVAITYEKKEQVEKFLNKKDFEFIHIVEAQNFIKQLGLKSYPKNLFLDKDGILRKIENGVPYQFDSNQKMSIGSSNRFVKIIEDIIK